MASNNFLLILLETYKVHEQYNRLIITNKQMLVENKYYINIKKLYSCIIYIICKCT